MTLGFEGPTVAARSLDLAGFTLTSCTRGDASASRVKLRPSRGSRKRVEDSPLLQRQTVT